MDLVPYASVGIPAGFLFAGTWLVQRGVKRSTSTDATQRLIDQYQEDRDADRKQFTEARAEFVQEKESMQAQIDRAWARIEAMEVRERARAREQDMRERIYGQYIEILRAAVPPPPPDYPPELRRG